MFRRQRDSDDFAAEIDAHLQLEIDRLCEEGLSDGDACAAAHRRFGNVTIVQERFYESGRRLWWDRLMQDVRFAERQLRKSPGFTAVAVLTTALGIGSTTAIFSVVDATLLHSLPYPHPEQLVTVQDDFDGVGAHDVGLSEPEWQDLEHSSIFEHVSPTWFDENNLTGAERPEKVRLLIVAPNYFALLGVAPQLGRAFDPADHSPGVGGEVVISDGLWKREFGADPKVLGRSFRMDTDLYRIVGVMPPGFDSPERKAEERHVEVWAATSFYGAPLLDHPLRSGRNVPSAVARIRSGLTVEGAQRRLDALVGSLRRQYPGDYPEALNWRVRLVPLQERLVGGVRRALVLLLGAVGLVLLIGCVNVANLLLARAGARQREMAVRQALGAAPWRLTRQLLTESIMLSLLGGAAGLAVLLASKDALLRLVPDRMPHLNVIAINWSVLLFAVAASGVTGVLFGLAPALNLDRLDLNGALRQSGRGTAGHAQTRPRRLLVVAEFALSLTLMVAAGLLLRSFRDLVNVRLGYDASTVVTVRTRLPYPNDPTLDRYATPAGETPFLRELLRRARALPGVQEAAIGDSTSIPLNQNRIPEGLLFFTLEHGDDGGKTNTVQRSTVTPEYFHLLGIPVLRGRAFTELDNGDSPPVAVVNGAFARVFWPNEDAVGHRFRSTRPGSPWITVVGVIGSTRTQSLAAIDAPQVYLDVYQTPSHHLAILLRGHLDVASIGDTMRHEVQALDDRLPVFDAQPLGDTVSASLAERRFSMEMVALFALTALVLAALGIYGVIAYMVSERTREIGIRIALGADRPTILGMIFNQGAMLTAAGAVVGIACALAVSHLMAGVLYGVTPTDPPTFVGVAAVLIAVALVACYLPARRAIRVDPLTALRQE